MTRRGEWIQTYTGVRFYTLDPRVDDVRIVDIAPALSLTVRFGGHVSDFYSVAQHSLFVSTLVPQPLKMAALLHDAAEAYFVDMPRPIKRDPEMARLVGPIERKLDIVIAKKFGFPPHLFRDPAIKKADLVALATEARDLMSVVPNPGETWGVESPVDEKIQPLSWRQAGQLFLDAFHEYGGQIL